MLLTTLPQKSIFKVVNPTKDCKMASAKYITKTCVICGKEYQGIPQSLYCSKECHSQELLRRWHVKHPKPVLKRVCLVCGKEFVAESQNQKTCSLECRKIRYNEDWKRSYNNRMADPEKKAARNATCKAHYKKNFDKISEASKTRKLESKRELAQSLQTAPVIENNNGNIKQNYLESLGIKRLSERGCECLKCGNKFNLICAERGALQVLNRLVASGKSPCPYCGESPTGISNHFSSPEYEIQGLFPNFAVHGYRPDWMEGLEIDLYDPVAKVGLEYHGIRAHSTAMKSNLEASKIHEHKADLCDANGVQLIQLYETEWLQKREIVIDKLNAIFHKDMRRLYARKLKVVLLNDPVNRQAALKFLDKNHIQGKAASQWAVGLCDGIELVAVCTFKYGTAYASGGQANGTEHYWELNRYATKLGTSVVGGLSRCIKYFVKDHPEVHTIVSFADRRWTSPIRSAYSSSGFVEKERIRPNYMYSDLNAMHPLRNKQYMRKSNIARRGESCYSPDKTETEMSKELGFYKIYDAGKIRYEMSV